MHWDSVRHENGTMVPSDWLWVVRLIDKPTTQHQHQQYHIAQRHIKFPAPKFHPKSSSVSSVSIKSQAIALSRRARIFGRFLPSPKEDIFRMSFSSKGSSCDCASKPYPGCRPASWGQGFRWLMIVDPISTFVRFSWRELTVNDSSWWWFSVSRCREECLRDTRDRESGFLAWQGVSHNTVITWE